MDWYLDRRSLPLVLIVLGCAIAPAAAVVTAQSSSGLYVTIGDVSVSPENPAPGERTIITAEFHNAESATESLDITEASVRGPHGISDADDLGTLGPGGSVTAPFSVTFDTPGMKELTVYLRGYGSNGNLVVIQKPVYVDVRREGSVALSFSTIGDTDFPAGGASTVNVTVANGYTDRITGLQLELTGTGAVENPDRIKGSIASGNEATFQYDVTFDEVGTGSLTGELTYQTADGTTRSTTKTVDVTVVEPIVSAGLSASTAPNRSDASRVEVTNFGNVVLADVEVTAEAGGAVIARGLVADIDPDRSGSVVLNTGTRTDENLTFTASYDAVEERRTTSITTNVQEAVPGEIRLTGIEASRLGTAVTIDGEAANVGSTDVVSVVVSVHATDGVTPTAPSGEYFVGGIEASEFATFELTADAAEDIDSIPVTIAYIVDNERVTTTQRLEIGTSSAPGPGERGRAPGADGSGGPPGDDTSGGGIPLPLIGGVLVIVAVAGFAVYRWRQQ